MNLFIQALEYKERMRERIGEKLSRDEVNKASRDWHAKRRPRHCGITIHTGVGCPYRCRYCYIYSMGFPTKISKYALSPLALIYALLRNPYFVPGINGTFLAIGSVTEPFHPLTINYTIELLDLVYRYLGNPTQISTKGKIGREVAYEIRKANPVTSVLYTVTTLDYADVIEPYAPTPIERYESMAELTRAKVHVYLFIRPILPGITDKENTKILDSGLKVGVNKVVYGSLRINRDIYQALKSVYPTKPLKQLISNVGDNIPNNRQRYIRTLSIKKRLVREAREGGFLVYPSACSANIDSVGESCYICRFGPCGEIKGLPEIDEESIRELFEYVDIRIRKLDIHVKANEILLHVKQDSLGLSQNNLIELIKSVSRRRVRIIYR